LVAHFYPPMRGPQAPPVTRGVDLKGHDHFVTAARIVAKRFPEARFVLVGGGSNAQGEAYRQSLIDACRADGFDSRVFFPGHRNDIAEVLASFDVAVQCPLTETLGGTIEALLMERPTVATRVGGIPESVRHEETGLLVPAADPVALAAAIERLLANPDEGRRFGAAGRKLMLERFTLARTGADLAALYERVAPVS
jgi:glycosyltransferase involved in cell wall biosynthesis